MCFKQSFKLFLVDYLVFFISFGGEDVDKLAWKVELLQVLIDSVGFFCNVFYIFGMSVVVVWCQVYGEEVNWAVFLCRFDEIIGYYGVVFYRRGIKIIDCFQFCFEWDSNIEWLL